MNENPLLRALTLPRLAILAQLLLRPTRPDFRCRLDPFQSSLLLAGIRATFCQQIFRFDDEEIVAVAEAVRDCRGVVIADPPVARAEPELVLVLASLDGVEFLFKDEIAGRGALLLDVHFDDLPWRIGQGGGDEDGRAGAGVVKGDGDRDLGPGKIHGVCAGVGWSAMEIARRTKGPGRLFRRRGKNGLRTFLGGGQGCWANEVSFGGGSFGVWLVDLVGRGGRRLGERHCDGMTLWWNDGERKQGGELT
ncbi:hypothetical protein BC567DRAFT_238466 [Phyllosticta citribraziliensis]